MDLAFYPPHTAPATTANERAIPERNPHAHPSIHLSVSIDDLLALAARAEVRFDGPLQSGTGWPAIRISARGVPGGVATLKVFVAYQWFRPQP